MTQLNFQDTQAIAKSLHTEVQLLDRETLASIAVDAAAAMFSLNLCALDDIGEPHVDEHRHAVILRLHGVPAIFLTLACDREAGAEIASVIFEVDRDKADVNMIDDSLRELANIFAGQVKSLMAPDHEIGLPRVQKEMTALRSHDWQGVSLRIGDGEQVLDVAVAA